MIKKQKSENLIINEIVKYLQNNKIKAKTISFDYRNNKIEVIINQQNILLIGNEHNNINLSMFEDNISQIEKDMWLTIISGFMHKKNDRSFIYKVRYIINNFQNIVNYKLLSKKERMKIIKFFYKNTEFLDLFVQYTKKIYGYNSNEEISYIKNICKKINSYDFVDNQIINELI